tara:strand:- start:2992 stop:3186 length:195 start_codon:yes stop_codon:yes gene_type:complete
MKRSIDEALIVLFKGQTNVKLIANEVDISLREMQELFRDYVAKTPVDENAWKGDVEVSWPYSGN